MNTKFFKSLTSVVLAVVMIVSMFAVIPMTVSAATTEVTFNLGADGTASHADGSSKTSYTETVNDYELSITGGAQFYTGARDAKGNSCIKLGSSKTPGSFSFTVPADVTSVVIYAAQYKANTSKVTANGTTYTLSGASNNGEYDAITVDTSSTKTVSFASATGGVRCMVNTIVFVVETSDSGCEHANVATPATCTSQAVCADCGESFGDYADHDYSETVPGQDATCDEDGYTEYVVCSECGAVDPANPKTAIPAGHNYVDGVCSVCGEEQPSEAELSFADAANRTTSTTSQQVWEENGVTLTYDKNTYANNLAEYANPARFYKGTKITITFGGQTISQIVFNANSNDYATALANSTFSAGTATADGKTVTVTGVNSDTLTCVMGAQVRLDSIVVFLGAEGSAPEGGETETTAPETDPETETTAPDPEANSTLTIEQAVALGASKEHNVYTEGKYYVTGVVTDLYNTQYGNFHLVDANGNDLTIYGTYSADGQVRYDALDVKPMVGDVVTVYGVIGQYNDKPQMKNGWIVEFTPGYDFNGFNIALNEGVTVNVSLTVTAEWLAANPGAYVVFNGETIALTATTTALTADLTPGEINKALTVVLYTADGTEVASDNVSVADYKAGIEALGAEGMGLSAEKFNALVALVEKVIAYGDAATGNLVVRDEFAGVENYSKTENVDIFSTISATLAESANVMLGINVTEGYNVVVTYDGEEIANGALASYLTDGKLVINGMYPSDFDKVIAITVTDANSDVAAEASFTFNQYLKALYNNSNVKSVSAAAYQYGLAAEAYLAA